MKLKILKKSKTTWSWVAVGSNGKALANGGTYARERDAVRGVSRFCDRIWDGKYEIEVAA